MIAQSIQSLVMRFACKESDYLRNSSITRQNISSVQATVAILNTIKQTISLLGFLLAAHVLLGQDTLGYIDYDRVSVTLPDYQEGQKALDTKRRQLQDSINVMFNDFKDMLKQSPHNVKIDSTSRLLLESTIRRFEEKIRNAQQHGRNEFEKRQTEIQIKLKNVVAQFVKEYCVRNNIASIVDKKSLVYCKDCVDFTDELIKYIKNSTD